MTVNSDHKFQPGRSGNPKGRPRGSKRKGTQLIERLVTGHLQDVKDILAVTVEKARQGESWAVREILARLWPIPRDRTTTFELREIRDQHDVVAANNDLLQPPPVVSAPSKPGYWRKIVAAQSRALASAQLLDLAAEGRQPLHKELMAP